MPYSVHDLNRKELNSFHDVKRNVNEWCMMYNEWTKLMVMYDVSI